MLDLLRSLEWANVGPCCPSCERVKMDGHAPDCRLDRAIREMASEPTVDEMARDARPTFADKLRALGLPTEMEHNGMYCHDHRGPALWIAMGEWVYSLGPHVGPGRRRWPTAEAAVDELYAEWVAKQQAALAAWLFARVVPGQTIAEIDEPVMRSKGTVAYCQIGHRPHDGVIQVDVSGTAACYPPQVGAKVATAALVRLLNPDGTVLWEAP